MAKEVVWTKYGIIYYSFYCRNRKAEYCWIVK